MIPDQRTTDGTRRVPRQCACCGAAFTVSASRIKRGRGTYCSVACRFRDQRQATTARFWEKADTSAGPDACWPWREHRNRDGYGGVTVGGRHHYAHRVAYERTIGPIPPGLVIDHLCRNPSCVNPAHMEPVTILTNTLRGKRRGPLRHPLTHCKYGHPFDDANTRFRMRPEGQMWRQCRACEERRDHARRAARTAVVV